MLKARILPGGVTRLQTVISVKQTAWYLIVVQEGCPASIRRVVGNTGAFPVPSLGDSPRVPTFVIGLKVCNFP